MHLDVHVNTCKCKYMQIQIRLSWKWFHMHRRIPAPPKCAVASPPPLCTCSRCSCPPANKSLNSLLHHNYECLKLLHLEISFPGLWGLIENQPMNNICRVHQRGVAWLSNQVAVRIRRQSNGLFVSTTGQSHLSMDPIDSLDCCLLKGTIASNLKTVIRI